MCKYKDDNNEIAKDNINNSNKDNFLSYMLND